jgi:hypothetical protein
MSFKNLASAKYTGDSGLPCVILFHVTSFIQWTVYYHLIHVLKNVLAQRIHIDSPVVNMFTGKAVDKEYKKFYELRKNK